MQDYFGLEEEKNCIVRQEYTNDGTTSAGNFSVFLSGSAVSASVGYIGRKEDFPPEKIVSLGFRSRTRQEWKPCRPKSQLTTDTKSRRKEVALTIGCHIVHGWPTLSAGQICRSLWSANSKKVKGYRSVGLHRRNTPAVMEDIKQLMRDNRQLPF